MEDFITFKPINIENEKYIESFYLHVSNELNCTKKIIFFPNTKNAMTIYKNARIEYTNPNNIRIKKSTNNDYCILYGGIQSSYIISEIESPFEKIGIIFKPLGINHFIDNNLNRLIDENKFEFKHLNKLLFPLLDKVYLEKDARSKFNLLETFFSENVNENEDLEIVENAIEIIEKNDGKILISELSKKLNISSKKLSRKFNTHLNCSPKQYCKLYLFRKVLNEYINNNKNLTSIALNSHYYDQPDFIKNFKKITGQSPSKILSQLKNLGNNIYWIK